MENERREFRGYYCSRCHLYTRLYRTHPSGAFQGNCPRCGTHLTLPATTAHEGLFFTGGGDTKKTQINVRDACGTGSIIGSIATGTPAQVLETTTYNGVIWYRIRVGPLSGWVSGAFIRKL